MSRLFPAPATNLDHDCLTVSTEVTSARLSLKRLSPEASKALWPLFRNYRDQWNTLVDLDRSGTELTPDSPVHKDYLRRRQRSTHPLRHKSWKRVTSIPLDKSIRPLLKAELGLDWRKVTKPRLIRFGTEVAVRYVQKGNQKRITRRDPSLSNAGICLTEEGMSIRVQSPMDTYRDFFVPSEQLTKAVMNQIVQQAVGRIHIIGLDPIVPPTMRGIKAYLTRKLRNAQAEGALVFRSPRRVSLGEKYLRYGKWNPNHLDLWHRKLLKPWAGCFQIMGLTGAPLLAREHGGGLVTGPLDKSVHPIVRANDVLQTVLAKLDLWHSATFLHSKDRQRVHKAFRRHGLMTTTLTKRTS